MAVETYGKAMRESALGLSSGAHSATRRKHTWSEWCCQLSNCGSCRTTAAQVDRPPTNRCCSNGWLVSRRGLRWDLGLLGGGRARRREGRAHATTGMAARADSESSAASKRLMCRGKTRSSSASRRQIWHAVTSSLDRARAVNSADSSIEKAPFLFFWPSPRGRVLPCKGSSPRQLLSRLRGRPLGRVLPCKGPSPRHLLNRVRGRPLGRVMPVSGKSLLGVGGVASLSRLAHLKQLEGSQELDGQLFKQRSARLACPWQYQERALVQDLESRLRCGGASEVWRRVTARHTRAKAQHGLSESLP